MYFTGSLGHKNISELPLSHVHLDTFLNVLCSLTLSKMYKFNVVFIMGVLVHDGVALHRLTQTEVLISIYLIHEWARTSETIKNMMQSKQLQLKP